MGLGVIIFCGHRRRKGQRIEMQRWKGKEFLRSSMDRMDKEDIDSSRKYLDGSSRIRAKSHWLAAEEHRCWVRVFVTHIGLEALKSE